MPRAMTPGLYIHIPFCASRCSYCSFYSTIYDKDAAARYLGALRAELCLRDVFSPDRSPSTVFIGGGTPTSFSTKHLAALLDIVPETIPGTEITCEMNPESVTHDKLSLLLDRGVTRCSFGVQTFKEDGLRLLGRRHTGDEAKRAVTMAVDLGFSSVNIDLIHGWPGQDALIAADDVRTAVSLGARHVSCYSLMLDSNSVLARVMAERGMDESDDGAMRDLWEATEECLGGAGFEHYETSNYAMPGFRCRHNVDIWKGGAYLGIGAAAHSHLDGRRFGNVDSLTTYIERLERGENAEVFSERLSGEDKARECAVFWLRLFDGIDFAEFHEYNNIGFMELYKKTAEDLLARGWLRCSDDGTRIFVPEQFHPVLDSILVELI